MLKITKTQENTVSIMMILKYKCTWPSQQYLLGASPCAHHKSLHQHPQAPTLGLDPHTRRGSGTPTAPGPTTPPNPGKRSRHLSTHNRGDTVKLLGVQPLPSQRGRCLATDTRPGALLWTPVCGVCPPTHAPPPRPPVPPPLPQRWGLPLRERPPSAARETTPLPPPGPARSSPGEGLRGPTCAHRPQKRGPRSTAPFRNPQAGLGPPPAAERWTAAAPPPSRCGAMTGARPGPPRRYMSPDPDPDPGRLPPPSGRRHSGQRCMEGNSGRQPRVGCEPPRCTLAPAAGVKARGDVDGGGGRGHSAALPGQPAPGEAEKRGFKRQREGLWLRLHPGGTGRALFQL